MISIDTVLIIGLLICEIVMVFLEWKIMKKSK